MDQILVKGLEIFAYHGVNPEEKEEGQRFVLDFTLDVDLALPCRTDCVDDTVSYAKVIKSVTADMLAQKDNLIERAAQRVAQGILDRYARVQSVELTLKKPDAPVKATFDYAAVHIRRERGKDA